MNHYSLSTETCCRQLVVFKIASTLLLLVWSSERQSVDNSNSSSSQGFFGNLGASNRSNVATPSVSWFNLPMDQFGHLTGGRNVQAAQTRTSPAAPGGVNTTAARDASQVSLCNEHIRHLFMIR